MWKWIKTIQATKHEHALVTENKNIQSELREACIRVMRVNGQPTSCKNEMERCYEIGQ